VIADLDTLLIALYVELVDRIIPARGRRRRGPGRPPVVTDAEQVCLAVAQVLLRYNGEHHWLRAAPSRVGHLFPRLLGQSEYNQRLKDAAPLMAASLRWLAAHTPGSAELLRLPTAPRSAAASPSSPPNARTCSATPATATSPRTAATTGASSSCSSVPPTAPSPGSAWPTPSCWGEREQTRQLLTHQAANRPAPGTAVVTDKGLSGEDTEQFFADLGLTLIRPARTDEQPPRPFPNWLRQRVEAII